VFWGEVSASAADLGSETVVRTLIRDVTAREESRQRLERYREYTDRLLDAVDDLFFVFDGETRLQRWNGRVPEVTGYADQELREMSALNFVPEEERERVAAQIADGFTTGHAQMEIPLLREDGTTVPYEIVGNLVEHPEGGLRVVGIGRDITERRRRKRTLEQQNDLFERAQEIADIGAWAYDVQTGEFTLTDQGCRIHGLAPDGDMTPERSHELFHPEDRPRADEAFKQASEGIGREYEGTGLGLTVTREVLGQMGGSIEVETEKGAGSCFTVRLPLSEESGDP